MGFDLSDMIVVFLLQFPRPRVEHLVMVITPIVLVKDSYLVEMDHLMQQGAVDKGVRILPSVQCLADEDHVAGVMLDTAGNIGHMVDKLTIVRGRPRQSDTGSRQLIAEVFFVEFLEHLMKVFNPTHSLHHTARYGLLSTLRGT